MIPLKNMDPRQSAPVITVLLIVANFAVFLHQVFLSPTAAQNFIHVYGLIPARISYTLAGTHHVSVAAAFVPLVTCMFLHGGWLHILGNMLFLGFLVRM